MSQNLDIGATQKARSAMSFFKRIFSFFFSCYSAYVFRESTFYSVNSEGIPYANSAYTHRGWVARGKFNIAHVEQKSTHKSAILKIVENHTDFERERNFLKILGKSSAADFVVELKDALEPSIDEPRFGLVEEPLGKNLWDYLRQRPNLGDLDLRNLALSVVKTMAALHSKRVVHGDLKPQQFCFVPNQPGFQLKLVDFDSAFSFDDESHRIDRYTLLYAAPEVRPPKTISL